jgi:hypothetical protein
VARGFIQVEDIDFNDFFSFFARVESIRIVFAILAIKDLKVHQMDVKIIFLNVNLSKEIYICNISRVCGQKVRKIWYVNFKNLCMV